MARVITVFSARASAALLTAVLMTVPGWLPAAAAPQPAKVKSGAGAGQPAKAKASTAKAGAAQAKSPGKDGKKPSTVKGWVLHQNNRIIGDAIVYLTRDAVKLERPKTPLCLLCRAPDFTVQIYNTTVKSCYSCDVDKQTNFLDTGAVIFTGQLLSKIPLVATEKTVTVAGVSTQMYESTKAFNKKMEAEVKSGNIQKSAAVAAEYYGAKDFSVPPQLVKAVNQYYGIPCLRLYPIKCIHYNGNHEPRNEVTTSSCVQTDIPLSTFDPPQGYKAAKREADVTDGGEESLEGVIDVFYGGKQSRPKHSAP